LDGRLPAMRLTVDSPIEDRHAYAAMSEEGMGAVFEVLAQEVAEATGVSSTTTTITGVDGNDITLYLSRPVDTAGPLPAVLHLHGGGMAIASAADLGYIRLREHLAATGLVVVGVEFRNSSAKLGPHPYPAGLNDCASAARWVSGNRDELGISHFIASGESGGGNLTLTLAHKAKREGWIDEIAGFYAQCPFISNRWLEQCDDLPSLEENDEYFVSREQLAVLGSLYDPAGAHEVPAFAQLYVNGVPLAVLRRRRDVAEEVLPAQLVGDAGRRRIQVARAAHDLGPSAAGVRQIAQRGDIDVLIVWRSAGRPVNLRRRASRPMSRVEATPIAEAPSAWRFWLAEALKSRYELRLVSSRSRTSPAASGTSVSASPAAAPMLEA